MERYIYLKADKCRLQVVDIDESQLLKELQHLVGGYIEIVRLPSKGGVRPILICNDMGALYPDRRFNELVDIFFAREIYGDVVLATEGFRDGEPDIMPIADLMSGKISPLKWIRRYMEADY